MSTKLSTSSTQSFQRSLRLSRPVLCLTLCLGLAAAPVLAQETAGVAQANAASSPQAELPWLSGGVGDEALQEMRKAASGYNLQVMFSNRLGSYLASVPFKLSSRDGHSLLSGVSEGPLVYVKLAPGTYQFSAEIDGAWQSRSIRISSSRAPVRLMFVARGG
ncbi:MAG: hypothetical protein WAV95_16835 [Azonexus sp.]